ncbi:streptolysin S family TOMM toxin [Clostridium algidicarnis]|uniref:streptolysin S family TOMM toxin n=1 Tax=Clostridium algidicarnis TaxID=37659 RepID=UPI000A00E375|nr:streptolysin S family TOMM toxin [Clostridium algidicarnis]
MLKMNSHLANTCNNTEKVTVAPGACCTCCCCCCVAINAATSGTATGGAAGFKP